MLLGFFMNAAIDQNCEKYITENKLEKKVESVLKETYDSKGLKRHEYRGELPKGNNGLGLLLLGITGDMVLPTKVYEQIKKETLTHDISNINIKLYYNY